MKSLLVVSALVVGAVTSVATWLTHAPSEHRKQPDPRIEVRAPMERAELGDSLQLPLASAALRRSSSGSWGTIGLRLSFLPSGRTATASGTDLAPDQFA